MSVEISHTQSSILDLPLIWRILKVGFWLEQYVIARQKQTAQQGCMNFLRTKRMPWKINRPSWKYVTLGSPPAVGAVRTDRGDDLESTLPLLGVALLIQSSLQRIHQCTRQKSQDLDTYRGKYSSYTKYTHNIKDKAETFCLFFL